MGFKQLTEHIIKILDEPDTNRKKQLTRSKDSFNVWQSMLRGAGVISGSRRCQDVCPVGADYEPLLKDALEEIPEHTPEKQARLDAVREAGARDELPQAITLNAAGSESWSI